MVPFPLFFDMTDSRIPVVQASPPEGSSSLRRASNRPPGSHRHLTHSRAMSLLTMTLCTDVSSTGRTNGEEYRVDAGYRPISESFLIGA